MNPWEVIRRENDEAIRSAHYQLANRRHRQAMNEQTEELPLAVSGSRRPWVILATVVGLVAIGIGGYLLLTGMLGSPTANGDSLAAVPPSQEISSTAGSTPPELVSPTSQSAAQTPPAINGPQPRPSRAGAAPTPTPTCHCVTPSAPASPSATTSPSATATPTVTGSPAPPASLTGLIAAPTSVATR